MTRVSEKNKDKIKESILSILYHNSPKSLFGAEIAREIIRDEEFVKKLLFELERKGLITAIKKSSNGIDYSKRIRWRLTNGAYKAYKEASVSPNTGLF